MENARDDIPVPEGPALAGAEDAHGSERSSARQPGEAPANVAATVPDADRQREELHASFNDRISYLCKLAALVIAVVALATMVLGQEMPQFVLMGLCLSVALLAIAMLQDHSQRKR